VIKTVVIDTGSAKKSGKLEFEKTNMDEPQVYANTGWAPDNTAELHAYRLRVHRAMREALDATDYLQNMLSAIRVSAESIKFTTVGLRSWAARQWSAHEKTLRFVAAGQDLRADAARKEIKAIGKARRKKVDHDRFF